MNTEWLLQYTTNDTAHCDADIEYDVYFDSGYTSSTSLPSAYSTSVTTEHGVTLGYLFPTALSATHKIYRPRTDLTARTYYVSTTDNNDQCCMWSGTN